MPLAAKYCSQCGAAVGVREMEGRLRRVCTACDTVFYQNPLPVAAGVLLNPHREVLLVKRANEPKRGEWCLPMGFAELGETIAEAAQRELREETGVEAKILHLLDLDSYESDFYGDLLIASFELESRGGVLAAGDDAADVRYFSLDALPSLAFSSNDKAIRACVRIHSEVWAMQASYARLQSDSGEGLLSDPLVTLIRDHAEDVTQAWRADVRSNPTTPTYGKIEAEALFERGFTAVSQFGRWLRGHEADEEIKSFYLELGRERRRQGFAVHELISSLSLLRKHVWIFARAQGVLEKPSELYRSLELSRRIALFFDKSVYWSVRGFEGD